MKTLLTILLSLATLAAPLFAGELQPSKYLQGTVLRDVEAALANAKAAGKPVVLITYDIAQTNNPKLGPNAQYDFGSFFGLPETRKLFTQNFVQVMAPWNAKGVAQFRDMEDKAGHACAIFIGKNGTVVKRLYFVCNAGDALKRVQDVVAEMK